MPPLAKGLPGEFLLLFTLLIWLLLFLVLLASPHNKLNRWYFASGMCFSIGALKEYLAQVAFPQMALEPQLALQIYSVLTAIPYYLGMPTALIFALHLSHAGQSRPKIMRTLPLLLYLPALLFCLRYPLLQTRYYQLHDPFYYRLLAVYDLSYGLVLTFLLLRSLARARSCRTYHQKFVVVVMTLLPLWFLLLSTFLPQLLRFDQVQIWQGNLLIIALMLVFYFYNAFQGGVLGVHLRQEKFDWDKEGRVLNQSAQLIRHTVKNEVAKIEWCARALSRSQPAEIEDMRDIILRATAHLNAYMTKVSTYSRAVVLQRQTCCIAQLLRDCIADALKPYPALSFTVQCEEQAQLYCDPTHLKEVLQNLFSNAAEAMQGRGTIQVQFTPARGRGAACLRVSDSGQGMPPQALARLFEPYSTTKSGSQHMGLGLYYCWNVMREHGGSIQLDSRPQQGCSFLLRFPPPSRRARRKAAKSCVKNRSGSC